jgi:GntR family transcriptional repressor for pyruvate dehydrogenase complex
VEDQERGKCLTGGLLIVRLIHLTVSKPEVPVNCATPTKSLVNDLIDLVRRDGYGPGDRLPSIRQLSTTLGLGRNAVRDGLVEAQSMGLVRIEPRLGVFVRDVNPEVPSSTLPQAWDLAEHERNLFHLVDARLLMEVELVAQAARNRRPEDLLPLRQALDSVLESRDDRLALIRADEEFHLGIARIAGNSVLLAFLRTLFGMLRPAKMGVLLSSGDRALTDREHVELFRSLLAGDAERAQATMRAHLAQGRDLLLAHLHTMPGTGRESA